MKALVDVVFRCGCFMGLVVLYCYFEVRGVEWLFPGCVVEGRHAFFGTAAALAVLDGARVWWTGSCLLAVFGLQRYRSSLSGEVSSPAAAELASLQQTRLDSLEFFAFVAFAIGSERRPIVALSVLISMRSAAATRITRVARKRQSSTLVLDDDCPTTMLQ